MNGGLIRLWAMALKELKVVLLDKRARTTLILSPVLQLILFGLATTLEVNNYSVGIVNRDSGRASEQLIANVAGSPGVRQLIRYPTVDAMDDALVHQKIIAGLVVDERLSRDAAAGRTGEVLVLLDGRRSNAAQIVSGYLARMAENSGAQLRQGPQITAPQPLVRHWYNANLDYRWFTMPAMIAVISAVLVLSVSAQSIARERELGTIDQLLILPLRTSEVIAGKIAPAFVVGLVNASIYVLIIPLLYGVPLRGSLTLLYAAVILFTLALVGIGLLVSAIAQSQQQAFLGMFLSGVPLILLSGYASPVDNMPHWLQTISLANPVRHMLTISEGVFLKDMSWANAVHHLWPLALIALCSVGTAALIFRSRLD